MARKYGNVTDVFELHGTVKAFVADPHGVADDIRGVDLTPDEARLLGLRLISLADKAEEADW